MGYRFQFVTLAGFHSINHGMYELARGYRDRGMAAYAELQQAEFASEAHGYTATRHQREVGTGYFDLVNTAVAGAGASTTAMEESTEALQFERRARTCRRRNEPTVAIRWRHEMANSPQPEVQLRSDIGSLAASTRRWSSSALSRGPRVSLVRSGPWRTRRRLAQGRRRDPFPGDRPLYDHGRADTCVADFIALHEPAGAASMAFERVHPDPLVQRNLETARALRDAHLRRYLSQIKKRAELWQRFEDLMRLKTVWSRYARSQSHSLKAHSLPNP